MTCCSGQPPHAGRAGPARGARRLPGAGRARPSGPGCTPACGCALDLEREHVAMLAELAAWHAGLPLESKVAAVIARHAPVRRPPPQGRQGRRPAAGRDLHRSPSSTWPSSWPSSASPPQLRRTPDGLSRVHPGHQVRRADVRHLRRARGRASSPAGPRRCRPGSGRTIEIVAEHGRRRAGGAPGPPRSRPAAGGRGDR